LDRWLVQGDFLLVPLSSRFDCVVGNPPYVRKEVIPDALIAEYRARYRTVFDRADLYIPFIERSLGLLADGGNLGFICADRWMKNRYGGPLRRMVAANYHLKAYIDMVDTPAFLTDVMAYPAITVISKANSGATRIARRPAISRPELWTLARDLTSSKIPPESKVKEVEAR
jgi:Eco57I restriction-modification methylase